MVTTTYMFRMGKSLCSHPMEASACCGLWQKFEPAIAFVSVYHVGHFYILANVAVGKIPTNRLLVLDARSGPRGLTAPIVVVVVVALNKSGSSDT